MSGLSLPDALSRLAELIPERVSAPHEKQASPGWHVNACGEGKNWARLSFTSGPEKAGWTAPTWEALGVLTAALERELEARGWDWHTHHTGPVEYRRHCAQVYPAQSALSGMFQAYADLPAHALALALIAALEAE